MSYPLKALAAASMLCFLPLAAHAAKRPTPLSEADAAALQGKTAAVVQFEIPPFTAATTGKATFGIVGALSMIKAGNDFVRDNAVPDPAVLVRDQLSVILRETYGLQTLPADATATKEGKPAKLAKLHPETDYVLSVRNIYWNYIYYPTDWTHYHLNLVVSAQLIDTKSGRPISDATCTVGSKDTPIRPTLNQLRANGAQLTKDIFTGFAWRCVQQLAKEQFNIPAEKIPAIPAEYVDPLARLQPATATPAPQAPAATGTPAEQPTEAPAAAPAEPAPATTP